MLKPCNLSVLLSCEVVQALRWNESLSCEISSLRMSQPFENRLETTQHSKMFNLPRRDVSQTWYCSSVEPDRPCPIQDELWVRGRQWNCERREAYNTPHHRRRIPTEGKNIVYIYPLFEGNPPPSKSVSILFFLHPPPEAMPTTRI